MHVKEKGAAFFPSIMEWDQQPWEPCLPVGGEGCVWHPREATKDTRLKAYGRGDLAREGHLQSDRQINAFTCIFATLKPHGQGLAFMLYNSWQTLQRPHSK